MTVPSGGTTPPPSYNEIFNDRRLSPNFTVHVQQPSSMRRVIIVDSDHRQSGQRGRFFLLVWTLVIFFIIGFVAMRMRAQYLADQWSSA
ncbi:hypothetical protein TSAR_008918 [Trichomalopsis sarcophagae]|uniref:Uncharacterized protein n=1 Tax=Trichomalopsis sarcophagae TaxID=543379 RepID=A0A232F0J6_9HYME|nr:hypothetical protein TSAR_008918 [Trichomalopsis sarcophagae]